MVHTSPSPIVECVWSEDVEVGMVGMGMENGNGGWMEERRKNDTPTCGVNSGGVSVHVGVILSIGMLGK